MTGEERGWCGTCGEEVAIDGRELNEEATAWTHMRAERGITVGMGHALGCWGDCGKHGCPVPEPVETVDLVECGPVSSMDRGPR